MSSFDENLWQQYGFSASRAPLVRTWYEGLSLNGVGSYLKKLPDITSTVGIGREGSSPFIEVRGLDRPSGVLRRPLGEGWCRLVMLRVP